MLIGGRLAIAKLENLRIWLIPTDWARGWLAQIQTQPSFTQGGRVPGSAAELCLSLPPSTREHTEALAAPRRCEVRKEGMKHSFRRPHSTPSTPALPT